jgi:opacity protein-like surface antigen
MNTHNPVCIVSNGDVPVGRIFGRLRSAGAASCALVFLAFPLLASPACAQLFVEGSVASGFGSYDEKAITPPPSDTHFESLGLEGQAAGLGLGYRVRLGNFVIGPRVGFTLSALSGSARETDPCPDPTLCATKTTADRVSERWTGSAQLEAGYVVADRLVFLGSYGWAHAGIEERSAASFTAGTASPLTPPASTSQSASASASGPVWSAGVEYLLGRGWSVGFRYENTTLDLRNKPLLDGATAAKYSGSAVAADVRWYL